MRLYELTIQAGNRQFTVQVRAESAERALADWAESNRLAATGYVAIAANELQPETD